MADRKLTRAARVRSSSYDADTNTIDVVWSTGAPVARGGWDGDYIEVLSMDPDAVRLDRLNAGAPFLDTHDSSRLASVIGSVVPGSARIEDGRGVATVQLSRASSDREVVGKIRDGVIRNISVGYYVYASEESERDGVTTSTATDWEPLELSAVPIPADAGAQIRSLPGGVGRHARDLGRPLTEGERMRREMDKGTRHWQGVVARQGVGARKNAAPARREPQTTEERERERGAETWRRVLRQSRL